MFRYPYLFDFFGLKDTYAEKDLEAAILREMESFILELGAGFAFLERQKRIILSETFGDLGGLAVQSLGHTVKGFINALPVPWPARWDGMTGMHLFPPLFCLPSAPCAHKSRTQV